MIRLLKIEWKKLSSYPVFWVFLSLYFGSVILCCSMIQKIINGITTSNGQGLEELNLNISIYQFPDIWHNLTYVAGMLPIKIFLGVFFILFICNEFNFKTFRAGLMNGLSKLEVLLGKVQVMTLLAITSALVIFILANILGKMPDEVADGVTRFSNSAFIGAYFVEILQFLSFALLFGILFRSTGLSIILFLFYQFFEYILTWVLPWILPANSYRYLPMQLNADLIRNPASTQAPQELIDMNLVSPQFGVEWPQVGIAIAYTILFLGLSYLILRKRDI